MSATRRLAWRFARFIAWKSSRSSADWVWCQLIQATPWGDQPRFLLRDRDASFGKSFASRARAIGIETVLSPFRCPQANGIAERMVGTFRQQCLDHVIVLNERHLLHLLTEYVEHYNGSKPHRSLELSAPQPRCALRWQAPPATSVMTTHCKYLLQ